MYILILVFNLVSGLSLTHGVTTLSSAGLKAGRVASHRQVAVNCQIYTMNLASIELTKVAKDSWIKLLFFFFLNGAG